MSEYDKGLERATELVISRRKVLGLIGGAATAGIVVAACGNGSTTTTAAGTAAPTTAGTAGGTAMADFAGAKVDAVLSQSFITPLNELRNSQGLSWGSAANAVVDVNVSSNFREIVASIVADGAGGSVGELQQNQAFLYEDSLADVSDLAEELGELHGGWYDVAREAAVVNGVWRTIPWSLNAGALNYRTDFFEQAGITTLPTTYDELLAAATKLKDAGVPLAATSMSQTAPGDSANFAYSILWSFGGSEVDESGKTVTINSPETRAALEWFKEFSEVSSPALTAFDEGGNNRAFLGGETSLTQNGPSIYYVARQDDPEGVFANMSHFLYPEGPAGRSMFIGVNSYAVFNFAEDVDAAKDYIRNLLQPANLEALLSLGVAFYTPLWRDVDANPAMPWNQVEALKAFAGVAEFAHLPGWPGPSSREAAEAYSNSTIVNMFASVATGTAIDDAVSTAEAQLKSVYEG